MKVNTALFIQGFLIVLIDEVQDGLLVIPVMGIDDVVPLVVFPQGPLTLNHGAIDRAHERFERFRVIKEAGRGNYSGQLPPANGATI